MATKIGDAKPVKREIEMQGMTMNVEFNESGIFVFRKGDRHREKRHLCIPWDELLDLAHPNQSEYEYENGEDYEPLAYLEYEDEQ